VDDELDRLAAALGARAAPHREPLVEDAMSTPEKVARAIAAGFGNKTLPVDVKADHNASLIDFMVELTLELGWAPAYFIACLVLAKIHDRAVARYQKTTVEFWDQVKDCVNGAPRKP
jgi:hypothetical protein